MTYTKAERKRYNRNYRKGIRLKDKKKTKKELNAAEKFDRWRRSRECPHCKEIYISKHKEEKYCIFCKRTNGKEV